MKKKQGRGVFRTGKTGACEANLFEFSSNTETALTESNPPCHLIAAKSLQEAVEYMAECEPDFPVRSVRRLGVIVLLSGSPYQ